MNRTALVLVLGMHRSGTSAVAGLLARLGVFAGKPRDLMSASRDNPKGYFERRDVVRINDRLLAATGAAWDHPLPFDPRAVPAGRLADFQRSALKVIDALSAHPVSMIKDPRMCLTLPLWKPLVPAFRIVFTWRNPLAVCRSLQERGMASRDRGLALWEHYVLASLRASRGMPTHVVRYEDLVTDTPRIAASLRTFCVLPAGGESDASSWIDPNLRRQADSGAQIDQILSPGQFEVYRALLDPSTFSPQFVIPELSNESRTELLRESSWFTQLTRRVVAEYRRRFWPVRSGAHPKP